MKPAHAIPPHMSETKIPHGTCTGHERREVLTLLLKLSLPAASLSTYSLLKGHWRRKPISIALSSKFFECGSKKRCCRDLKPLTKGQVVGTACLDWKVPPLFEVPGPHTPATLS
jgi:hypothetical protein